ncbi:MAG TPA: nucleotidyltransferase family protein [Candidatus Sulfotelmatobacter sp.]|nr:nucleotidyltransferase family protein [Candidatus Sulfotelmatobacter sp.]
MSALAAANAEQASPATPSLDPEWSFLRTAVSPSSGGKEDRLRSVCGSVRWKRLFELAERHGVQPLLYQALSRAGGLAPPAEMRVLGKLHETNLHKMMLLSRELIHVVDHMAQHNIEVLPYKGAAVAEAVYGDIALRQAGDIDLLIRVDDLPRIQTSLHELGYEPQVRLSPPQERASLQSGYECVFEGPAGRNLLEVQWAIQPRFYAVDFDQESFFRRAVPITVAGHPMKTASPEDLILLLSLHAAKHVWGRLIWLCDLARLMSFPALNWDAIAAQARDLGIVRILRVSFLLAGRLLHMEIPDAAGTALPADPQAEGLAQEIEDYIAGSAEYDVESVAYFRLMLRLRESRRDRIRFVTRLALTPGPAEWAMVQLPEPLFPLYRVVRFWRLAGRLARR